MMKGKKFLGWTVTVLQKVFRMKPLDQFHSDLRALPCGTTGKSVADLLDTYNYRLIPRFPNHDLKHLVLDYDMKLSDEIKMQSYLVGNGNYTWPCLLFLSLGLFKPSVWSELKYHYQQGKSSNSIFYLNLNDCMHMPLSETLALYGRKTV